MEPVVTSFDVINDSRPTRMVLTLQAGLKERGWKSEMVRQSRVEGAKRPDGVCMRIAGGLKG